MNLSNEEKVLAIYREAKRIVAKAEADPEHRGIEHARETLVHAKKLMKQYKLVDDA